jgi:hypothetical protein
LKPLVSQSETAKTAAKIGNFEIRSLWHFSMLDFHICRGQKKALSSEAPHIYISQSMNNSLFVRHPLKLGEMNKDGANPVLCRDGFNL